MKIKFLVLVLSVLLVTSTLHASTGVGVVFGLYDDASYIGNTGLSLKFDNFPVLGLKWSLGKNGYLGGTVDYWLLNDSLSKNVLFWYLGVGAYAWLGNGFTLGGRLPIGLQLWPIRQLEFFIEAVPSLKIIENLDFNVQGALGIRYHF